MKKTLLLFYVLFSSSFLFSQQAINKSSIASAAGVQADVRAVNITKWSLSEIPLVVLQEGATAELGTQNWKATVYPNPFVSNLTIQIETTRIQVFLIELRDLSGRKILISSQEVIEKKQSLGFDLGKLPPAIYLLSVLSKEEQSAQVIKIQKAQ